MVIWFVALGFVGTLELQEYPFAHRNTVPTHSPQMKYIAA